MLRSMYSGISGLRNFQTKLDVIGNNIANVNTYGFKKGRVIFKDLISQSVAGASAPSESRGGVNSKQIGLGSQISAIDTIHTGGSTQFTGNTLDLAISGDGFFQVAEGVGGTATTGPSGFVNTQYTRAGNFYMDNQGYLVNSDGKYLVGSAANVTTEIIDKFKFNTVQGVNEITPVVAPAIDFSKYKFLTNKEGERITMTGTSLPPADPTITGAINTFNTGVRIQNGFIYTDSTTENKEQIEVDGNKYDIKINETTGALSFEKDGTKYSIRKNEATPPELVYADASDENDAGKTIVDNLNIVNLYDVIVPHANMLDGTETNYNYTNDGATLRPIIIPTTAQSMSVGQDGTVTFVDDKGKLQWAGQLQLAKFPNPGGLGKVGGNYFQQTANSGDPVLGIATASGLGAIESGFLEMSNVDLAEEFTEMIVAQRGFQANTRIITTSDEILQELVNLKR